MLYSRWLTTSRCHENRPAVFDGGRVVSFGELAAMVERRPVAEKEVVARTGGVDFFVEILRGWRDGRAVIPVERGAPGPVLRSNPPEGTCLVKYTPGASGIPRGIFFNAAQVCADADRLFAAMEMEPEIPNLAVISLAHSYGFSNVVLPLVLHGVPVRLAEVPFPRVIEGIFKCHKTLVVPSVPSIWRAWHRAGILKHLPVHRAFSAGAPLSLDLEREVYAAAGLKIRNFYGTSECGGISLDRSDTPREDAAEVGEVLAGVAVSVGGGGRLLVKSDAVATGYDGTREDDVLGDGIHLTRDRGFFGKGGILHLAGSTGNAINVAGRKVSPAKVEAALMATGLVARAKVLGIPSTDAERHEEIAVLVEGKEGVGIGEVKGALAAELEAWELPRHWQTGPELWKLDEKGLKEALRLPAGGRRP